MYRFLITATLLINRFLLLRSNELAGFENTTYHTGLDQYPEVIDNSTQQAISHSDILFELPYQSDITFSETLDFHQSDELIPISYRDLFFSKRQITTAATLWAEFLLDVDRLDFSDEKTKALVDVLYEAIIQTEYDRYSAHLDHLQIGHSSFYGPPIMIKKAAEKIGVYPAKFEKVEMLIYTNGNILFNERVVCTNAEVTHYESNTLSFDNAPYMVITGDKFKLFEIPADPAITLYEGGGSDIREFYLTPIGWESVRDNKLYVKVYTHEFLGSESELLAMTNEALYQIIQDPNKVKTTFKSDDSFFIWTDKPGNIAKYYGGIGTVNIEKIHDSYYQVSTGVVRVLSAPQKGTVGTIDLSMIKPKDFIILHASDEKILGFMNEDFRNFKARLCTREGYILSEQIFKPGDSVPTFSEVARQYENTFIFQETLQSQHHCSHEVKTNLLAHQDRVNVAVNGGATHLTFTKYQLKVAAALWAQYLPGAGKFISFDEINKMSKLAYDPLDDFFIRKNQENAITSKQLDQFINYLYEGIISKHHPDSFLIIGHASFYGTPEVVKQAVEKAKIDCFADVTFPYKSEMRIFNNGNIYFNGQMYCTNPDITHYNSQNTFFDNAPWMIIKGDKFKIFEIPYTLENLPFEGFVEDGIHNDWAYLKQAQSFGYRVSDIPEQGTLYIRVSLRDFSLATFSDALTHDFHQIN